MIIRKYNINIKGVEVILEKIVTRPITLILPGNSRKTMFVADVYSLIYSDPMYTTEPSLTAANATERAFRACIVSKNGEPV